MSEVNYKKRRGVVHAASITRLSTRLNELESRTGDPNVPDLAKQMMTKIESLNSEFKTLHYAVIDETEDKEFLLAEQDILDTVMILLQTWFFVHDA